MTIEWRNRYCIRTSVMFTAVFFLSTASLVFAENSTKMLARKLAPGVKKLQNRKIAVLPFPHHDGRKSPGSTIISERLTTYLGEFKTITVIERTLLDKVLGEHKLEATGIIDQETTKEIGKILGVEAIVTGTLIDLDNKKTEVNARMIHTETGKVLSTGVITIKRTWSDQMRTSQQSSAQQSQPQVQQTTRSTQSSSAGLSDKQFEFIVKMGMDFQGKVFENGTLYQTTWSGTRAYDFTDEYDVDNGISLSGEMIGFFNNHVGIGAGLTLQMARKVKDIAVGVDGEFYFTPIYGLLKIRFPQESLSPYFVGHGGYNFVSADSNYTGNGDIEGGAYVGGGAGIQFNNGFLFELLYSVNYAYLEIPGSNYYEIYTRYEKLRLAAGFAF